MRTLMTLLVVFLLPLAAAAETWKNVAVIDTVCLKDVREDPDAHTKECALQCKDGGYGLLTADGDYLAFDTSGNEKTLAALNATSKTDHLRATVEGTRDGETVKVTSITIE